MSMFGKVLAFLNVLGAIALAVVFSMDLAKRKAWEYNVFLYDLRTAGLPLDRNEVDLQGRPLHEKVGADTQQRLFGGEGVASQEDEVTRVQQALQGKIQAAGGPAEQSAVLARILLPLARSNAERERLFNVVQLRNHYDQAYQRATRQAGAFDDRVFMDILTALVDSPPGPLAAEFVKVMQADPKRPFDQAFVAATAAQQQTLETERAELQGQFDQAFSEVLQAQRQLAGQKQAIGPEERRAAIAHLLFCMLDAGTEPAPAGQAAADPLASPGYRRFLTTVGLSSAIQEINNQAGLTVQMAYEAAQERDREQTRFALAHEPIIEDLKARAVQLEAETAELARAQQTRAAQETLVARRQKDVDNFTEDLAKARQLTAARMQELNEMNQALFGIRIRLRDALAANQEYVKQIRKMEMGH